MSPLVAHGYQYFSIRSRSWRIIGEEWAGQCALISSLMTSTKCFLFVCFVWFKEQYLDVIHFFSGIFITTDWGLSQKDFSKIFNHLEDCKFLTSHTCFAAPFQVIRLLQIVELKFIPITTFSPCVLAGRLWPEQRQRSWKPIWFNLYLESFFQPLTSQCFNGYTITSSFWRTVRPLVSKLGECLP